MLANSSMSLSTTTSQYGATVNKGATGSPTTGSPGSNPYLSDYDPATTTQQMQQAAQNNQSNALSGYLGTQSASSESTEAAAAPDLSASLPNNPVSVPGNVSGSTDAYAAQVQTSSSEASSAATDNFGNVTTSGTGAPTPDGSLVPSETAPQSSTMVQQQTNPEAVEAQQAAQAQPPADTLAAEVANQAPADAPAAAPDDDDVAVANSNNVNNSDDDDDSMQADNDRAVADARANDKRANDANDVAPPPKPQQTQAPKQDDSANQPPPAMVQAPMNEEVVVSDASVSD